MDQEDFQYASSLIGDCSLMWLWLIAALPVMDDSFEWKAECSVGLKINCLPFGAACTFLSSGMKQPARSSKLSATPKISHWSIKSFPW